MGVMSGGAPVRPACARVAHIRNLSLDGSYQSLAHLRPVKRARIFTHSCADRSAQTGGSGDIGVSVPLNLHTQSWNPYARETS